MVFHGSETILQYIVMAVGGGLVNQLDIVQDGEEMPQDWTTLFDGGLYTINTGMVPQVGMLGCHSFSRIALPAYKSLMHAQLHACNDGCMWHQASL